MRNPIHPHPERPFPLPDRVLDDGWWLTAKARGVNGPAPRDANEEGEHEPDRRWSGYRRVAEA